MSATPSRSGQNKGTNVASRCSSRDVALRVGRFGLATRGTNYGRKGGRNVNEERDEMSDSKSTGPESGARGVVEDVKGKVKEAAGALSGRDELRREGEAQQEKASAQRDVAAKEAQAEKARLEAKAREAEQRSHQS
jgi:uncharacterized protein YjbJ (UPF0337 family)